MWIVWDRWNNNDAKAKPTVLSRLDMRIVEDMTAYCQDALSMTALPP